jgi:lysophospholipase L1-like esterase
VTAVLLVPPVVESAEWKFTFTSEQPGYIRVTRETAYDSQRGFGFLKTGDTTPDQASIFAVDVDEGNYDVTITFGDTANPTASTIKAESRRLMVQSVETAAGKFETRTFTVNVRKPAISTGSVTSLNDREKGPPPVADWDDHLSFEFNGKRPGVASLEIKPSKDAITVFVAGDSTVTDQAREPYAGWGQCCRASFSGGVAVSNQAESGLALFSFERQRRLEKILGMMKKGDYLLIQFGHNDQKDKRQEAGPFTTYKDNLKRFIGAVRDKGGTPILVTPMERRRFNQNGKQSATLADYAEAVRQVGNEESVPVIDLNAMSLKFYGALGPDKSTMAFVHYPANTFPRQEQTAKDDTHHNAYGAFELARCVVEGIKAKLPDLAAHLVTDLSSYDPAQPDLPDNVRIPLSPLIGSTESLRGIDPRELSHMTTHIAPQIAVIAATLLSLSFTTSAADDPASPAPADPSIYLAEITQLCTTAWPKNRTVNIVCHGHSVPAGYFKTPEVRSLDAYPHLLREALANRFPHAVINVIVTAIGGENSEGGAKRFDGDVLVLNPELVMIDYSLNDRTIGLERAEVAWSSMIESALAKGIKVICLTPTPDLARKFFRSGRSAQPTHGASPPTSREIPRWRRG